MYLVPDVYDMLVNPGDPNGPHAVEMSEVQADLDNFVWGGRVTIAFEREPLADFRRLDPIKKKPRRVWEMRTVRTNPGNRLFGLFADTDIFVGVALIPKDRVTRDLKLEMQCATTVWTNLFGPYQPIVSENPRDYISNRAIRIHTR